MVPYALARLAAAARLRSFLAKATGEGCSIFSSIASLGLESGGGIHSYQSTHDESFLANLLDQEA
jgi:hypothetical protein